MKKLSLIIPFSISHVKIACSIALLVALPQLTLADRYGCFVTDYPYYIFYNPDLSKGGHPNYLFSSDDNNYPDTYYQRNGRCPYNITETCYLYNYNGSLEAVGYVTDFAFENCPLDDDVPLMFIFTLVMLFTGKRICRTGIKQ